MKKKILAPLLLLAVALCLCLCAFTVDPNASVKSLTKPYIDDYECKFARLGNEDLLEKLDYLKISFIDDKTLEFSYKRKNGKRNAHRCEYVYDEESGKLEAEIGIFGFKFKQSAKIENGKFTVCMPILGKPLILLFST